MKTRVERWRPALVYLSERPWQINPAPCLRETFVTNQYAKPQVPSPCINVCQMDAGSGLCRGCFRTLDEIAGWSRAGDDEKIRILAAVDRRRAEHDPWGESFRGECVR